MSLPGPLAEPSGVSSIDALRATASQFARDHSCNYFAYLLLRPPSRAALGADVLVSDYPAEWQQRYMGRHYKY
jgi:Autoinducer binding domain